MTGAGGASERAGTLHSEPVLCFVRGDWAYFTNQPLSEQWGDDWNDAPYECNAGEPYRFNDHDRAAGKEPWQIVKVAFSADLEYPCDGYLNSPWSVEQINSGAVAWLRSPRWEARKRLAIPAGTPLSEFIVSVEEYGGEVYVRQGRYVAANGVTDANG